MTFRSPYRAARAEGGSQKARPIVPYLILFTAFCLVGLLVTCALLLS